MKVEWLGLVILLVCLTLRTTAGSSQLDHYFATYSFIPTALATDINPQCIEDSRSYVNALLDEVEWAQSMHESSGKLPDGLYNAIRTHNGNTRQEPGLFDQCLAVRAQQEVGHHFSGQYCSVFLKVEPLDSGPQEFIEPRMRKPERPTNPIDMKAYHYDGMVGFCLPSSCSASDLQSAVAQRVGRNAIGPGRNLSVVTVAGEDYCFTEEKIKSQSALDFPAITMTTVLGLLVVLVLLATAYDVLMKQTDTNKLESMPVRALRCFSLCSNGKSLFSVSTPIGDISCLHGIRVITTSWLVMVHMSEETYRRINYNRDMLVKEATQLGMQTVANGAVAVDTFYLIGGMLVAASLLRELDRNKGRLNLFMFYFHRYMRLTPVYAAVLGFVATLWTRIGSGPDWTYVQYVSEACREKWWIHMLYLNNYVIHSSSMICLPESWYVATDFQMFVFSPLFIYPLWRWRRTGLLWAILSLAALIGANILAHWAWDLPATVMHSRPSLAGGLFDYLTYWYWQTYLRFPPYLLGILLGYALHKTKGSNLNIPWLVVVLGWILAAATSAAVVYGLIPYLDEKTVPVINPWFTILYGSLNRVAWAAAVGWVIFACIYGYGGWANRFLSWKLFVPLARVTYCVYLIHYNLLKMVNSFARKPLYYTFVQQGVFYFGILTFSFGLAVILALVVEIPFFNLEKLLTSSSSTAKKPANNKEQAGLK